MLLPLESNLTVYSRKQNTAKLNKISLHAKREMKTVLNRRRLRVETCHSVMAAEGWPRVTKLTHKQALDERNLKPIKKVTGKDTSFPAEVLSQFISTLYPNTSNANQTRCFLVCLCHTSLVNIKNTQSHFIFETNPLSAESLSPRKCWSFQVKE